MKLFFLTKNLFLTIIASILLGGSALAFTDFNGTKTTVEDELGKGKWSVVEIWASWCHACMEHMPEMVGFDGKMDNLKIIGVTIDGQEGKSDALAAIKEHKMNFKNIISNSVEVNAWMEQRIKKAFKTTEGLIGTPTFMLFDPKGELVAVNPGKLKVSSIEKFINAHE